jgi:hypothetical protein
MPVNFGARHASKGVFMYSRQQQKLGGLFILIIGIGFTLWNWHNLLAHGFYYRKTALIFPMFAVIGLGLIIFPGYREERLAKGENIENLSGLRLLTPRWWAILGAALLAGGLNWYFLAHAL